MRPRNHTGLRPFIFAANSPLIDALARYFRFREHGATLRGEVLGGLSTFAATAYIIVVNPAILQYAGIPVGPSTVATILTAVVGTLLMGLYANRPIAVATYMGENAFLAFGLGALGIGWQLRLGVVFISGIIFLLITLLGIRSWLADSISPSMKHSFAAGIGLFMAFIGLYQTGIVTSSVEGMPVAAMTTQAAPDVVVKPPVPLKIGNFRDPKVQLSIMTLVLTAVLLARKVPGAILISIVSTATAGYAMGLGTKPAGIVALPFVGEYSLHGLAGELDILGALRPAFWPIMLTLFVMSFLDTLGTLVGIGAAGGMLDDKGNFPDLRKPMLVDAASCIVGSVIGTSTSGAFIESAVGVREGARTGLAAIVTALLFAATLFFIPLVQPLQSLTYAYGPALVIVGCMMLGSVRKIEFDDPTEVIPAFLSLMLVGFTYNVANGLTAGLILHPVLKILSGRGRELNAGIVVLAAVCVAYYVVGLPH